MVSSLKDRKGTFLPKEFNIAHELCFFLHDAITEVIRTGEENQIFVHNIKIDDKDEINFNSTDEIFSYLDKNEKYEDRAKILTVTVLPAILSDMMHCIYETLENSRKAKLNISYMLIRKPIQENLYVLESIVLDEIDFAKNIIENPHKLDSKNAGGLEGHKNRITKVLNKIDGSSYLSSDYISSLRYNKKSNDSFDGICNIAMHLFTSHEAIRTEKFNINFIFSNEESKITQWKFLYSRLPYLLVYMHKIVEYILSTFVMTERQYLNDINNQVNALILLWWEDIAEEYQSDEIESFVKKKYISVKEYFSLKGKRNFTKKDIEKLANLNS